MFSELCGVVSAEASRGLLLTTGGYPGERSMRGNEFYLEMWQLSVSVFGPVG